MKKYRVMKDTPFHKEGEIISEDDKLLMYDKEYVPVEIDKLNHFDSFFKEYNQITKEMLPSTFIFDGLIYERVADTYCYTHNLTTWMSENFSQITGFLTIPELLDKINSSVLPISEVKEIRNYF